MDQTQLIKSQSRRYEIVKQAGRRRKGNRPEMGVKSGVPDLILSATANDATFRGLERPE
jgi:hypothetical protein